MTSRRYCIRDVCINTVLYFVELHAAGRPRCCGDQERRDQGGKMAHPVTLLRPFSDLYHFVHPHIRPRTRPKIIRCIDRCGLGWFTFRLESTHLVHATYNAPPGRRNIKYGYLTNTMKYYSCSYDGNMYCNIVRSMQEDTKYIIYCVAMLEQSTMSVRCT